MEYRIFEPRAAYEARQIRASTSKLAYCKFSYRDAEKYVALIRQDMRRRGERLAVGPTLCLGVRNGREVDCFRIAQAGGWTRRRLAADLERRWQKGFTSYAPVVERLGRSRYDALDDRGCIGVEINPHAARRDVWIGSYDALPSEWRGRFHVVFTNAFDHAYEPEATIACWRRVMRPGGYFILCFPTGQEAAPLDPVADVTLADVDRLFGGELIHYGTYASAWGYTEFIVRTPPLGEANA